MGGWKAARAAALSVMLQRRMASAGWCAALGEWGPWRYRGTSWQGPQAAPLCFGAILTVSALPLLAPAFPHIPPGDFRPHAAGWGFRDSKGASISQSAGTQGPLLLPAVILLKMLSLGIASHLQMAIFIW